uniref:Uncharacterized protein n=1 Tax=Rhizophora mucronata TaxID=61149 RepID=A0A2P2QG05_RHIMU
MDSASPRGLRIIKRSYMYCLGPHLTRLQQNIHLSN